MSASIEPIRCPEFIASVLREWESRADDYDECQLAARLEVEAQPQKPLSENDQRAFIAESFALEASPTYSGAKSPWGTYYGPLMGTVAEDGTYLISRPDIRVVDPGMVLYWEGRSTQTPHPVLRARYADILWDLRKAITGNQPRIGDARTAIDAYVATVTLETKEHACRRTRRLERALRLAISIGDHTRISLVRDAMFTLHAQVADEEGIGIWAFLFDKLYDNKKVSLTLEQEQIIISSLEDALRRVSDPTDPIHLDPHAARDIAHRLAKHYQKCGQNDEVQRVIRSSGRAFEVLAQGATGVLALAWLDEVHKDYRQCGMRADAERLSLLSRQKGNQAATEMRTITVPVTFDRNAIDALLEALMAGTIEDALGRLALEFTPGLEDAKESVGQLSRTSVLAQMKHSIVGDGHTIADIGPVDSDPDGHIVIQLGETIDFYGPILAEAIDRIRERFDLSVDTLLAYFAQSILFDPERAPLLRHGLTACLSGDHVTAVHVLVPQVEHILRQRLLAVLEVPADKPMNSLKGVMQEKSLTDILEHEPRVQEFFEQIDGSDCLHYLRVYLIDPRGHNVSNRLMHGLIKPAELSRKVSDRVLHILLMLAFMGRGEDGDGGNDTDPEARPDRSKATRRTERGWDEVPHE